MAAERGRHVVLVGLEVTDDASYGRYRAGMTPTPDRSAATSTPRSISVPKGARSASRLAFT